MNFHTGLSKAVVVAAVAALTAACVLSHHPVFGGVGMVLTFLALAGKGDEK